MARASCKWNKLDRLQGEVRSSLLVMLLVVTLSIVVPKLVNGSLSIRALAIGIPVLIQYLSIVILALFCSYLVCMKRIVFKRLSDAERHELEAIRKEGDGLCIESTSDLQNDILDGLCRKGILTRTSKAEHSDINGILPESMPLHTVTYCASESFIRYFRKHTSEQTR